MKLIYDSEVDILTIVIRPEAKWASTDELGDMIVGDFDDQENLIQLEILFAQQRFGDILGLRVEPPAAETRPRLVDAAE